MKHGDISNKPSMSLVMGLEDFSKLKFSRLTKKLTIEVVNMYPVIRMNDYFMRRDIQIIITAVLSKRYKETVEEYLDDIGLLYKEVIFADSKEELEEKLKEERLEKPEPYYYDALWT